MADEKKVKQERLPGMSDPKIEELEEAAENYAKIRDRRMALTENEVEAQELVHRVMVKNKKKHYRNGDIEITLVAEKEKAKVKIHKEETAEVE